MKTAVFLAIFRIIDFFARIRKDIIAIIKTKKEKEKQEDLEDAINNGNISDIEDALNKKR